MQPAQAGEEGREFRGQSGLLADGEGGDRLEAEPRGERARSVIRSANRTDPRRSAAVHAPYQMTLAEAEPFA